MIISLSVVQYLPEICILINYNGIYLWEQDISTFEFFFNSWGHPHNVPYTMLREVFVGI